MATSVSDELAVQTLILRLLSDSSVRAQFLKDPNSTISSLNISMSPGAKDAIVANAGKAAGLTHNIDGVTAAFFFFYNSSGK
jgi:hypothetical protein